MCYSPWGHKESDTTERLMFSKCPFLRKCFLNKDLKKVREWTCGYLAKSFLTERASSAKARGLHMIEE